MQFGEPLRWEVLAGSTREQQQVVADQIQGEIKRLYGGLEQYGRKGILRRVREQAGGGTPPTAAPTSATLTARAEAWSKLAWTSAP